MVKVLEECLALVKFKDFALPYLDIFYFQLPFFWVHHALFLYIDFFLQQAFKSELFDMTGSYVYLTHHAFLCHESWGFCPYDLEFCFYCLFLYSGNDFALEEFYQGYQYFSPTCSIADQLF